MLKLNKAYYRGLFLGDKVSVMRPTKVTMFDGEKELSPEETFQIVGFRTNKDMSNNNGGVAISSLENIKVMDKCDFNRDYYGSDYYEPLMLDTNYGEIYWVDLNNINVYTSENYNLVEQGAFRTVYRDIGFSFDGSEDYALGSIIRTDLGDKLIFGYVSTNPLYGDSKSIAIGNIKSPICNIDNLCAYTDVLYGGYVDIEFVNKDDLELLSVDESEGVSIFKLKGDDNKMIKNINGVELNRGDLFVDVSGKQGYICKLSEGVAHCYFDMLSDTPKKMSVPLDSFKKTSVKLLYVNIYCEYDVYKTQDVYNETQDNLVIPSQDSLMQQYENKLSLLRAIEVLKPKAKECGFRIIVEEVK